jgi:hypothetical protein
VVEFRAEALLAIYQKRGALRRGKIARGNGQARGGQGMGAQAKQQGNTGFSRQPSWNSC